MEKRSLKPGWKETLIEQANYGENIVHWLRTHFPDLIENGRVHPGAITGVIRLHDKYGKGELTVEKHGGEIRRYVDAFDRRVKDEPDQSVGERPSHVPDSGSDA